MKLEIFCTLTFVHALNRYTLFKDMEKLYICTLPLHTRFRLRIKSSTYWTMSNTLNTHT